MLNNLIKDLESKVSRAVETIDGLHEEKNKFERENESLRSQVEELQARIVELEKAIATRSEAPSISIVSPDSQEVKIRLERLIGKLTALEDSWN